MDARLQRRVQRYGWDKAAPYYQSYWAQQLEPAQTALLDSVSLRAGERVLDTACGTGLVTLRAAAAVTPTGHVVGTDVSDAMVALATAAATARAIDHVSFARMDAEALDLPDAAFDVALCALGLMYVPDARKAVEEMYRVVQPNGRAAVAVWGERAQCGWAAVFGIVDARVRSEVCPLFFQLGAGEVLARLFAAVGFADVRTLRIMSTLRYDSAESAYGAAFVGGPVALPYSRFSDQVKDEVHAEYLASIEEYRDGATYAVPGQFVIVSGRRP